MVSLLIHAALGVVTTILSVVFNRHLYEKGSGVSALEVIYYVLGVGSVLTGWYFNVSYMNTYPDEASWVHFTKMLFTNPASSSGGQDLIVTNAILFPLWTIVDGPRRGLKQAWIWFVMSLFTSFGFSMAAYLAAQERQVRRNAAHTVR